MGAVTTDIAYGPLARQRLDLYSPADTAGASPLLLFVHGGVWSGGDKAQFAWLGRRLARQGLSVAVANYRLSPAVRHPAHAQDVAAAAAWLSRHGAEYGGDPQRIYLAGHSAGAHLVSLVALDPAYLAAVGHDATLIRGVVGVSGAAYDLDARYALTPFGPAFTLVFGLDPSRWAAAAPLRHVRPGAPPFLLVHGLNDVQTPAAGARRFAAALRRRGVPTQLKLLRHGDHVNALCWTVEFLASWITPPVPSQ
jgi:acetyl esterase/lipase